MGSFKETGRGWAGLFEALAAAYAVSGEVRGWCKKDGWTRVWFEESLDKGLRHTSETRTRAQDTCHLYQTGEHSTALHGQDRCLVQFQSGLSARELYRTAARWSEMRVRGGAKSQHGRDLDSWNCSPSAINAEGEESRRRKRERAVRYAILKTVETRNAGRRAQQVACYQYSSSMRGEGQS